MRTIFKLRAKAESTYQLIRYHQLRIKFAEVQEINFRYCPCICFLKCHHGPDLQARLEDCETGEDRSIGAARNPVRNRNAIIAKMSTFSFSIRDFCIFLTLVSYPLTRDFFRTKWIKKFGII